MPAIAIADHPQPTLVTPDVPMALAALEPVETSGADQKALKSIMADQKALTDELDDIRVNDKRITAKFAAIINGVGLEAPGSVRLSTDTYCPVNCDPEGGPAANQPQLSVIAIDIDFDARRWRIVQVGDKVRIAQLRTHHDKTEFYVLFDPSKIIAKALGKYTGKVQRIEHIEPAAKIMTELRKQFLSAS